MIIAVDYDNTFSADPHLFASLISTMVKHGHIVIMVTGRSDADPWGDEVRSALAQVNVRIPIVFAGLVWKRLAAERAGYKVDVWIDDMPEYVGPQNPSLAAPKSMVIA